MDCMLGLFGHPATACFEELPPRGTVSLCCSYVVTQSPPRHLLGSHTVLAFPIAILNGTFFFREATKSLLWAKLHLWKFNHTTLSSRSCHTWLQGFSCGQPNSHRKGRWINHVYQKHLEPNKMKVISHFHKGNYSSRHQSQECSTPETCTNIQKPKNPSSWWWWALYNDGRNFAITTWMCHHGWL